MPRSKSQLARIEEKIDALDAKVEALALNYGVKIAKLEVKAGLWGALAGAVAALSAYLGLQ